jgi:hypothetical protein
VGGVFEARTVLFQESPSGEILPGVLTDRGAVDISVAVKKSYTPQLMMQGVIDDFDRRRPTLERLAKDEAATSLDKVRLRTWAPTPPIRRQSNAIAPKCNCRVMGTPHLVMRCDASRTDGQ